MLSRTHLAPCLVSLFLLTIGATTSRAADPPAATVADDGKAFVLDNGLVSLTLAAEHKRGVPGQVMYDALRLEVDPEAAAEGRP